MDKKHFQCVRCGYVAENVEAPPKLCKECECPFFRDVTTEPRDMVNPNSVAHLRKKVEKCFNYDNRGNYHDLKLKREVDWSKANPKVDPKIALVKIRIVCEQCGHLYGVKMIPLSRPEILEAEDIEIPREIRTQLHLETT